MNGNEIMTLFPRTFWVKSLQGNWHIYLPAQLRCSSLNRAWLLPPWRLYNHGLPLAGGMTIPLRRALLDRQINAPLTLSNYGF